MRIKRRRAAIFSVSAVFGVSVLLAGAAGGAVRQISPQVSGAAALEGHLPFRSKAPRHAPNQILVRFADSVQSPAEGVFDRRASFAEHTADRSAGLDELFRRFGVRGVQPVVREAVGAGGAMPAARSLRAADEAARQASSLRFTGRASRAPRATAAPALHHLYLLDLAPGTDVEAAAAAFAADPHIEFAEPNAVYEIALLPNDRFADPDGDGVWRSGTWTQLYEDLWGLESTGWSEIWERQAEIWPDAARRGGRGVVVAVIDTGVDAGHPDLARNIWRDARGRPGFDTVDIKTADYVAAGWQLDPAEDYTKRDFDPADRNGHGTHVAGTIAAVADNRRGIAGIAWASAVMPVRAGFQILDGDTRYALLEADDIVRALDRAVAAGADVVNMSFGGGLDSEALETAIARAHAAGVVLVAAAGNFNIDTRFFFPAAYEQVVAVAAVGPDGRKAGFSNWGRAVDIVAPGVDVLSLRARGTTLSETSLVVARQFIRASGTSMASPHVAGAAALLVSAFPQEPAQEIVSRLTAGALSDEPPLEPIYDGRFRWALGAGRLDAIGALTQASKPAVYLAGYGLGRDATSDGAVDPGEEGALRLVLRNAGPPLEGVVIDVTSRDPFATPTTGAQVADLAQGGELELDFSFTAASALRWGEINRFHVALTAGSFQQGFTVELALRGPRLKQGWPTLSATAPDLSYFAPALADLDGDSQAEVVAATVFGDVLALRADGTPLPGWPVHLHTENDYGGLNVADLDGDSRPEVVLSHGRSLSVLRGNGTLRRGWPVAFDTALRESAALGDLDGDGRLEVVVVEQAGFVHVLDAEGRPRPGWPRPLQGAALAAPLLVDLDGGGLDVVVAAYSGAGLFAFHADGSPVPGWPVAGAPFVSRASATADLDGDGKPEIVALSYPGEVLVIDARGQVRVRTTPLFDWAIASPAVGDLDGDGRPEIVVGGDFTGPSGALYALSADGQVLPGWPVRTGSWVRTSPALVDLDGDGRAEVVAGSLDGFLYALRADGTAIPGWPFFLGDIASYHLALGDLDRDGTLDITTTLYRFFTSGHMPIANVIEFGEVAPGAIPWPSGRGGPANPGAATEPY